MAEAAGLSITQTATLTRLKTPLSASGLTDRGLRNMQARSTARACRSSPTWARRRPATRRRRPARLRAGDSFAAAMSLGDITVAGIGTTTFVCDGRAVAFGHPFNWTGDTTMAIRAADTITIVEDPIFGSYKLANVAESLGTLTQDRLARHRRLARHGARRLAGHLHGDRPRPPADAHGPERGDLPRVPALPGLHAPLPERRRDHRPDRRRQLRDRVRRSAARATAARPWELTALDPLRVDRSTSRSIGRRARLHGRGAAGVRGRGHQRDEHRRPQARGDEGLRALRRRRLLVWNGSRYVSGTSRRPSPAGRSACARCCSPCTRRGTKNVDLSLTVPRQRAAEWLHRGARRRLDRAEIPCFIVEEECVEDTDSTFDQLLKAFKNQPPGDAVVARLRLGDAGEAARSRACAQDAVVGGRVAIGFLLIR